MVQHHNNATHFGSETVTPAEKTRRVAGVFTSVAQRYDLMNDVMSLGVHRVVKRIAVEASRARPGQRILDLACGTGDLAVELAGAVGKRGHVCLADINAAMLEQGRDRLVNEGVIGNVSYAQSNAEHLPFADDAFDAITMAFGLRNVTDQAAALASMLRVLAPGGRLVILEFSHPTHPATKEAFRAFSQVWPLAGKLLVGDSDSYRYLVESIEKHPDQATLTEMMLQAGFESATHRNLLGGIVAIHEARKRP